MVKSAVRDPFLWVAFLALVVVLVLPEYRFPALLVFIGLVLVDLLVIRYPERKIIRSDFDSHGDYVTALNDTRKTWAQVLGLVGAGGVVALVFTWTQLEATQEQQITDRYAKAVELLSATREGRDGRSEPNLEAHIGAIYALERIAVDSPKDHFTVLQVLTAYVRQHSPNDRTAPPAEGERVPSADLLAVFQVLRRQRAPPALSLPSGCRDPELDQPLQAPTIDLHGADLRGGDFHDAHFRGVELSEANLSGVPLDGADLCRAVLVDAEANGASFREATLVHAALRGAKLRAANFWGADVLGADFSGADLTDADFTDAKHLTRQQLDDALTYDGARLQDDLATPVPPPAPPAP